MRPLLNPFHPLDPPNPRSKNYLFEFEHCFSERVWKKRNLLFKAFFARETRERARKIKQKQNYVFSFSRRFACFAG
jgi:hypothetical protein